MDSQEIILEEMGNQEEVKVEQTTQEATVAEEAVQEAPVVEAAAETVVDNLEDNRKVYTTKKEVLDRIKEIAHSEEPPQRDEVEYLKTSFYKLHIAEREDN